MRISVVLALSVACATQAANDDCDPAHLVETFGECPGGAHYETSGYDAVSGEVAVDPLALDELQVAGSYGTGRSCSYTCQWDEPDGAYKQDACVDFSPCGGDPTGVWTYSGFCPPTDPLPVYPSCAGVEQTSYWEGEAKLAISPDGTFQEAWDSGSTWTTWFLPPSCTGGALSCVDFEGTGATCEGEPSAGCACTVEASLGGLTTSGSWSAAGSVLTFQAGGGSVQFDFCRDGEGLRFQGQADGANTRAAPT